MSHHPVGPNLPSASESQMQALLNFAVSQSSTIFYIADLQADSPIRFISANVEHITGHGVSAFLKDPLYGRRHIHPDDIAGYTQSIRALPNEGSVRHEYRFATISGEYRWFRDELRLTRHRGRDEFVGCMIDITAEKNAAQSLAAAEALKSAIVEAAQDAIVAIDAEGQVVDFNAKAEDIFGHRRDDVLGRRLSELIIPERLRAAHEAGLQRLRETGTSHMLNERVRLDAVRADGSEFPVELTVVQTTIHDKAVYVAEIRDISEKTAAEEERKRLLQLLEDAVESLTNGFTIWDSQERLILANSAFGQAYGLDPAELEGMSRQDVVRAMLPSIRAMDGAPVDDSDEAVRRAVEKLAGPSGQSVEIELANGGWRLATVHPTSDGGQVGLSTVITALKQKESSLKESENYFRSLVEAHPLPVWLVELDSGRILYESPAVAKLTGREWRPEEERFVQQYYVNPEDRKSLIKELRKKGELPNFELSFKRADGSKMWVSASSRHVVMQGRDLVVTGMVDLTDQRNREAELRHARETLEDAVESLSEGLVLYDADDRLVLCNSQYRAFHRESEDLLVPGAAWRDITRQRAERGLFTSAQGGIDEWLEGQMAVRGTATNEEFPFSGDRWFAYSHRPTRRGGFVSTWRDVTERKKREEELRHARETLEDAIEALTEGFVLYDDQDRLVTCNSQFRRMIEPIGDLFVPGARRMKLMRACAEQGMFLDAVGRVDEWLEERIAQHDETADRDLPLSDGRWIQMSRRHTRQGGLVLTWQDITERKRLNQVLLDSEAMLRSVLQACPVPITMNRANDGVILYESPAARHLLKYDESQAGSSVIERWANPEEREAYIRLLRRTGVVDGFEVEFKRSDGSTVWVALSARHFDYNGEQVIVSNLFDLTERRAAEAELAQQREMLHQAEKLSAFGELLAGVAHELNNPLSVLVGQALMLQEELFDEPTAARAEKIGKAADRCARIVKTFLAMARQEPTEIEPVDINAVIESALEVTAYPLRTAGVEVTLRLAKDLPMVMASSDQMRQVFTNLIVNAQNAMQENDGPRHLRITSSYRRKSDQITIKVKDNGPGIPIEIRSRIFEPLFTTKEVGAGTGIGLALCHRIIEAHGGTIVTEKGSGQGAVFAVRLPRGKLEDCPAVSASKDDGKNSDYRVLVVDDDYDVGQIISDVLESEGYAVEAVGSGHVALERVKRQKFDVILSDVRMPGMDGPGFYRALNNARPEQIDGLAFITGDTMTPKVKEFLEASERPYLEKPILPRDIRELVDLLLRRKAR